MGRIVYKTNRTYYAETYLKDHLGNIRAVFGNDGSGYGVMQTNTYYPFGMEILTLTENSTSTNNKNEYKYNGKMLQDELGLNWLDYGARFYDGVIGRWWSLDPLSETLQESYTPYHYCLNNPILHTDPDGRILPIIAAAAAIAAKAIIGATIDAGTQYALNRAQGMSHFGALNNLDYTSMAAAGTMSALTVPGLSTTVKTSTTISVIALDASIDISNSNTQTLMGIGDQQVKPLSNVALDATFSTVGTLTSSGIVDASKKAIANDLLPSNYAPLNAAEKNNLRTLEGVVNSEGYSQSINAVSNITTSTTNSTVKQNINSTRESEVQTPYNPQIFTMPADKTNVVNPYVRFK